MVEPPPSEGGEATITAMSALAAVGQSCPLTVPKARSCVILGWLLRQYRPNCLMIKICKLKTMLYLRSRHKSVP